MRIIAVTQDQLIVKDDVLADISMIGGYTMTNGEWAVHFDSDLGIGHVEYIDSRPNSTLSKADFDKHYKWLVSEHQKYLDYLKAKAQSTEQTELAQ